MRSKGTGQIVLKGQGRWLVRWTDAGTPGTAASRRAKVIRGTRRDAELYLAEVQSRKAKGSYAAPSRSTLREFSDAWLARLDARAKFGEKPCARTVADYRGTFARYILPTLGDVRLDELKAEHLDALYTDLQSRIAASGSKRGNGAHTVRATHAALRAALNQAVRQNRLAAAVTDRVKVPEQSKRDVRPLSPDEVVRFRDAARASKHAVLFDFLLATGCRPGEALALTWAEVDLDDGVARIRQSLSRPAGKFELREPKTKRSRRAVALNADVVRELRAHRKAQAELRLALGSAWRDRGLVFPNDIGDFADSQQLNRFAFKTVCRRAGLPPELSLYALRHTFATLALANGATVHEVAAAMGHTSPALVISTYGHALPERQAEVFSKVAALAFPG